MTNLPRMKVPALTFLTLALCPIGLAGAIELNAVMQPVANLQIRNLPTKIVGTIPRETCSGDACPDFWVEKVEFISLVDRTMQVKVYTKRVHSQVGTAPLKITVETDGAWSILTESNARVDGSASGFANTRSFNLPAAATQIGFILSPGLDTQESDYDNNSKTFRVQIADLSFQRGAVEQRSGVAAGQPNRNAIVTVINNGPDALPAGACTLNLELQPAGGSVAVAIPALPRRAQFQKKVPFTAGVSLQILSRIECNANQGDIITGNNLQSFRFP